MPQIKVLKINYCYGLKDHSLSQIPVQLPLLEKLSMKCTFATNSTFLALSNHSPNLRVINICDSTYFHENSFIELAKKCTKLQKICISRCPWVTDKSIEELTKACPLVKELDFWMTYEITPLDKGIISLASKCDFMERLTLSGRGQLPPDLINNLKKNCPMLRTLVVDYNTEYTF